MGKKKDQTEKQGYAEGAGGRMKESISSIPGTAVRVITNPAGFYREMPKQGGFGTPLLFMIAMGIASGILRVLFGAVGLSPVSGAGTAVASVVIVPVLIAVFGFIGAAIVFAIWKLLGSKESYETAYRCVAYAGAVAPAITLLQLIPYAGGILGIVWMTWMLVTASTTVHGIAQKKALIAFGAICAVLSLMSLSAEYAGRRMTGEMGDWGKRMDRRTKNFKDMTPEDARKAAGEFLKGLEKSQRGMSK